MKGVSFVTNEQNERVAVLIDWKVLQSKQEALEDFLYGLVAASRTDEESIDWEEAKKSLQKAGKL